MAKCAYCRQRKAKRNCPALGESICPSCCGRHREKEIHCPFDCRHLEQHQEYQGRKSSHRHLTEEIKPFPPPDDVLNDERLAWLALHIEAPLLESAERNPDFLDGHALEALDYAESKVEEERAIFIQQPILPTARNEIGELILQQMSSCRYERRIFLPGENLSYSREDKLRCLQRIRLSLLHFAGGNLRGKNYLFQVKTHFDQIRKISAVD